MAQTPLTYEKFASSPISQMMTWNDYQNVSQTVGTGRTAAAKAAAVDPNVIQMTGDSGMADLNAYIQYMSGLNKQNNAISQANAREQMAYQTASNAQAMAFNAAEAQKARDYTSFMSNTAHQREVADLKAAGLNPILSANAGASTPSAAAASGVTSSGAMGQVDTSGASAVASLMSTIFNAAASLQAVDTNAKTNLAIAALNNETQRYATDKSYSSSMYGHDISKAIANINYAAAIGASQISSASAKYVSDNQVKMKDMDLSHNEYMSAAYGTSGFGKTVSDITNTFLRAFGVKDTAAAQGWKWKYDD